MRDLWHSIMSPRSGLELQSHRFRLKTYNNCLLGSELVDWLLTYEKASNRQVYAKLFGLLVLSRYLLNDNASYLRCLSAHFIDLGTL